MIVDQGELDALSAQAPAGPHGNGRVVGDAAVADGASASTPELRRIQKLRVPVIAELARTLMPIERLRRLSPGAIIEFHKSVEEPLELRINNRAVGRGQAVKVGENFGLRILTIGSPAQRIRSMNEGSNGVGEG